MKERKKKPKNERKKGENWQNILFILPKFYVKDYFSSNCKEKFSNF